MAATFPGFPPEALQFLRRLKRNNNREWFLRYKDTYEQKVKGPMVELVLALGREMQRFAPEMLCDPGRAIYRIYRDTRFSADKTPYKTHIAATFHPRGMPKHNCAGLYFHIAPEGVEIAGGVYMPERETLLAIRRHIADHHKKLRAIIGSPEFRRLFGEMWGEQLTRPPKGFPKDHPAADLLRYKQFLADVSRPAALAESPKLLPALVTLLRAMMPLVRFLNKPLPAGAASAGDLGDRAVYIAD
ncbi:MAG TPA: DUF2461 domain-containing protein [Bryobacterales bacterium]|nr:DUF2461 domain-containing protein [Bryobacterales bacterium]